MVPNGHFSGRLDKAINKTIDRSIGRDGVFYEILNSYDFFDVDDINNKLTEEQRKQVPVENQYRMSQLASAIGDMIRFVLADGEYGILTKDMQNIIDKLDLSASSTKSHLDAMGATFDAASAVPVVGAILSGANNAAKSMSALTSNVMGGSIFDADIIPPITLNFPGMPLSMANLYKPGFFQANWDFLYSFEPIKQTKLWEGSDGYARIGTDIPLYIGGDKYQLVLRNIFNISSNDADTLTPTGDTFGGISPNDIDFLIEIAPIKVASLNTEQKNKFNGFSLNEDQMRSAFNNYVNLKLWSVILNRNNWSHGHWGSLTHNALPSSIKTAVSSFIWSQGLVVDNFEKACISYCLQMGLMYQIGYSGKLKIFGIDGINKKIENGNVSFINIGITEEVNGVPKDNIISKHYYGWIADIILRSTNNTVSELSKHNRMRRVSEANLIYKFLGKPTISFGQTAIELDNYHTINSLIDRKFNILLSSEIYRYKNEGMPGGDGGKLSTPEQFISKLDFKGVGKGAELITEDTKNFIKTLMDKAGVTYGYVTSVMRTPTDQARAMFNNLQNGNVISYSSKSQGNRGYGATILYYKLKMENANFTRPVPLSKKYSKNEAIQDDNDKQIVMSQMAQYIDNENKSGRVVSKHCGDPKDLQVLDISPKLLRPQNRRTSFEAVFSQALKDKKITNFLSPADNDPAYHIEITPKQASAYANVSLNDTLPDVKFTLSNNIILNNKNSWNIPLSNDVTLNREVKSE